jgi:hypothetical protein
MNKKLIFLFVALLLPGLVYTFLKMFGSNTFAVAPLFQDEVIIPAGCRKVRAPYHLPGQVFATLLPPQRQDSLLLVFYEMDDTNQGAASGNLQEIERNFSKGTGGIKLVKIPRDTLGLKCDLLIGPGIDIVLLDRKNIRGQYSSADRDDVDRLGTELDIILKKY